MKLPENIEIVPDKVVEPFRIVDDGSTTVDHNAFDFDDCNISEVIMFLQKLARSPNASVSIWLLQNISQMLSCKLGKRN